MFTGLVEATGRVATLETRGDQARLTLDIPFAGELTLGESVAINGCCLTATEISPQGASFDLLAQTLKVTSLGQLSSGSLVNLERAMQVGDRFGGHFVQGHVDGTGEILEIREQGQDHIITLSLPPAIHRLCVDKGSLALDGISLTIAELHSDSATFWIIPHTWEATNLQAAQVGNKMNLEADMLAKHVDKLMQARGGGLHPPSP